MYAPSRLKLIALTMTTLLGTAAYTPHLSANNTKSAKTEVSQKALMQSSIIDFDDNQLPDFVTASSGSTLSLSSTRYIMGQQSLKWEWQAGSTMTIEHPITLVTDKVASKTWGRKATQVLSFWIYNETPVDDYMIVDLGRGLGPSGAPDAGIKVKMNFSGWRTVGVSLQNDLEGREIEGIGFDDNAEGESGGRSTIAGGAKSDMDSIRFRAPLKAPAGIFYIDRVMLSIDDARYQWSDDHVKTRYQIPEINFRLPAKLPAPTAGEIAAADDIRGALIRVFTEGQGGENGLVVVDNREKLRAHFAALKIQRDADGQLSGRHIITDKQKVLYQPEFMDDIDQQRFSDYVLLGDYTTLMFNISRAYQRSTSEEVRQELADMYILMTQHLLDQGYMDGSGLVTTHHWGYSSRWWYISAMLMANELDKHQLRQPVSDALLWYSREFKANFDMVPGPESSDLDYFNTLSRQHLALLMLESDPAKRVALLKRFGEYINVALSQTPPGGYDGLRPDGTAWRHEGNYPGYSFPAFKNAGQLVYMLHGTPFAVSDEGRAALKKAMLSAWVYSNPATSLGLAGRHPFNSSSVTLFQDAFRWLALTGDPKTGDKVDKALAAAYLQITETPESESEAIFGVRIAPAELPQGNWTFNGGAFGIHRFSDKMVTLKAYNSNVWSSEIYYRDNRYGRYQSHGAIQVLPYGNQKEIGFVQDGWDWNRNPGTTTIHLPLAELDSPNTHTLMLRGNHPFSGHSSLSGKYGMFAFKFDAPSMPKFDSSFTARKSALETENRLVLLGSNISNNTEKYATETTLFQHGITDKASDLWVNGERITALPYQRALEEGDWLIDGHGNGYLLTKGAKGEVRRQHQVSANDKSRDPTEGNFSLAWLDHGAKPQNAHYEYLMVLEATPEGMQQLATDYRAGKKVYEVLRQDASAHIVRDNVTQTTGYAAFSSVTPDEGVVKNIAQPAIVMTQMQSHGQLKISGVTPDLNMTRTTKATPLAIAVTLNGQWQATENNPQVSVKPAGETTQLVFTSYFGMPQEVTLKPMN
ncbi:chondroitinase family polysaccharide lyase [Yersinia pseudotuberculosis]|uniref:chondroitinase family polysaccharide lyase n=1 Tax=Yersinia pseudotuberculosis TaxID=633 RepID=UPI000577F264|nr:chondroitinase family polysaccharide lyase [Yersinia pseudotuberculosis]QES99277.1 chondroitin lyase [Yersinia pseudotuberculosis]CFU91413.1 chondroitin ABC lyase [Yersinia pseudotuberculosis]CNB42744.1 chondroitin ABC lyase [Yersinia pseudotuberculosis]CNB74985.1 chondroitin ABC lyase [Yersinia pseudotuberculosis]CRY60159.1 chondroitin ABC lyase [Yersinia pseudotuberculosis]